MRVKSLISVLPLAVIVVLTTGCGKGPEAKSPIATDGLESEEIARQMQIESKMPEFSRPTLSGDTLRSESLAGNVTLVNFWATWCGPCIVEIPEFVALYDEWSDRNFEIVGVSSDLEGFEIVAPFAEDFQMNYPIIMDSDGLLGEAFGGVYALPMTFVVGPDGIIVERFLGLFSFDELREKIEPLFVKAEAGP